MTLERSINTVLNSRRQVDRHFRRIVKELSGGNLLVIPANSKGPRPEKPYCTALLIEENIQGFPHSRGTTLTDESDIAEDILTTAVASYSVQWVYPIDDEYIKQLMGRWAYSSSSSPDDGEFSVTTRFIVTLTAGGSEATVGADATITYNDTDDNNVTINYEFINTATTSTTIAANGKAILTFEYNGSVKVPTSPEWSNLPTGIDSINSITNNNKRYKLTIHDKLGRWDITPKARQGNDPTDPDYVPGDLIYFCGGELEITSVQIPDRDNIRNTYGVSTGLYKQLLAEGKTPDEIINTARVTNPTLALPNEINAVWVFELQLLENNPPVSSTFTSAIDEFDRRDTGVWKHTDLSQPVEQRQY